MVITKIFDPISALLRGVVVLIFFLIGILYIVKGKQKEQFKEQFLMYGFASLFIFAGGFLFLFRFLADTQIIGYYMGHDFYGDFTVHTSLYEIYGKLCDVFTCIGTIIFFASFEYYFKRTRFIITLLMTMYTISLLVVVILFPISVMYGYGRIMNIIIPITVILMFIWLMKNSQEDFKIVSAILIFGYVIILVGVWADSIELKDVTSIVIYISPIFLILGSLVSVSPLLMSPERLAQLRKYWSVLAVSTIGLSLSFSIYALIMRSDLMYEFLMITNYGFNTILILLVIQTNKIMKERSEKTINILSMFTKPQKVTEEEVTISKERKTCLVCKGKILGVNFMCRECNAFYCMKCYTALTGLENACWSCEAALDETKPIIKPKSEDQIKIEIHNKGESL